jgi:hypothetical protein
MIKCATNKITYLEEVKKKQTNAVSSAVMSYWGVPSSLAALLAYNEDMLEFDQAGHIHQKGN